MANVQSLPLLLKELRLSAIAKALPIIVGKAIREQWEPDLFLAELCGIELDHRQDNRLKRLLKESKLPIGKQLSQYDFSEVTGVSAQQIKHNARCLVPYSCGISYNFIKGVNLWEVYRMLMPRQRHESEKRYKNLKRASLSLPNVSL
ncbi:MAG: hypothetical protein KAI17_04770 [Thiotrichaceae bacterium]|nr:hypothetical protein [Thiotrichaceae bacterium]